MQTNNMRWLLTGIVQIIQLIYNLFVEQYLQPYIITHIFHKGMNPLALSDPRFILFFFGLQHTMNVFLLRRAEKRPLNTH